MEKNQEWAPPVSFYFQVQFHGEPKISGVRFQEVSGLRQERRMDPGEAEDFQNLRHTHMKLSHENIVLKRALDPLDEELSEWIRECMASSGKIKPRNLVIFLMDMNCQAVACWFCMKAYPVKWEVSSFNAMKSQLAIETVEMAFDMLERKK